MREEYCVCRNRKDEKNAATANANEARK